MLFYVQGAHKLFENILERNIYNCTDRHANNLSVGRYVNFLIGHAISFKNYIVVIILIEIL